MLVENFESVRSADMGSKFKIAAFEVGAFTLELSNQIVWAFRVKNSTPENISDVQYSIPPIGFSRALINKSKTQILVYNYLLRFIRIVNYFMLV